MCITWLVSYSYSLYDTLMSKLGGNVTIIIVTAALLASGLLVRVVTAQQEICFCHNIVNNPVTICTDNQGLINGHMGHVNNGTDTLGECPAPTPTPTPTTTPTVTPTTTPTTSPTTTPATTPTTTTTAIPQSGISLSCRVRVTNNANVNNIVNAQTNTGGNSSNNNTQGGKSSSGKITLGLSITNRVKSAVPTLQCPSLTVRSTQRNTNTGSGSVNTNN